MASVSIQRTGTTLSLVVGICMLVFVLLGVVYHRCNRSNETFFGNSCALYDGRATRCSHLSEFECDQCPQCRWNIDQFYNGTCVRSYDPFRYVNNNTVYWGVPSHAPPALPVHWWDYPGEWVSSWWGDIRPYAYRRRLSPRRLARRPYNSWRRQNRQNQYTIGPWGRPLKVLSWLVTHMIQGSFALFHKVSFVHSLWTFKWT